VEELFDNRDYVNGRITTVTNVLRADPRVEAVDLSAAVERLGSPRSCVCRGSMCEHFSSVERRFV
jgi:hypothetical protein